ncbi:hypothetical protein [Nonomuraea jabiensis]|uniref:hypothetical protein n=1 Tax=Nonomuraea jabiensis TaxID=882448 RepID=UPI003689502F
MALEDIELGGQTIKAGSTLILSYATANRDPERFADSHVPDLAGLDLAGLDLAGRLGTAGSAQQARHSGLGTAGSAQRARHSGSISMSSPSTPLTAP